MLFKKAVLLLLLFCLTAGLFTGVTASGAEGVPDGYIPVFTTNDFLEINNDLTAKYILMSDLSFCGNDFSPVGVFANGVSPFSGLFDGNGHTVSDISVSCSLSAGGAGLFCLLEGGEVKNLKIKRSYFNNTYPGGCAGAVAGENYGGTVKSCYIQAAVEASVSGMAVGKNLNYGGSDKTAYPSEWRNVASVRIKPLSLREYTEGTVTLCYTEGCSGAAVCGYNAGIISDCSAACEAQYGITKTNDGQILRCCNIGNGVYALAKTNIGTVSGFYYSESFPENVADGRASGTGRKFVDLKHTESFTGYDFSSVWDMGRSYPHPATVAGFICDNQGDCNDDGYANIKDLVRCKKIISGVFTSYSFMNSDCHTDGNIDSGDLIVISRILLG